MLYRDQFIHALPNVREARKTEVIDHMKDMHTKALLFRLVEILRPFLKPDSATEIKKRAAGTSCILHQYHNFDWDSDDLYDANLQVLRTHYPDTHKIWQYYADRPYWSIRKIGLYYGKIEDLDDFTAFESAGVKHRSYTFVLYEILKECMEDAYKDAVYQGLYELLVGFSYFYDVIQYWPWQHNQFQLEFARFSELRTLEIMKQNGYDVTEVKYLQLQNYVLATGEYELFIEKARTHYQKSLDTFDATKSRGGRIRIIQGLVRHCDALLLEAEQMFNA